MNETTVDKIFSFKQLDNGWCYGEGITITDEIIEKAIRLEARARLVGFSETDAFPGLNGEISVALYFQTHYFEFTFDVNGTVVFVHEDNQITVMYDSLVFETALRKVESLRKYNIYSHSVTKSRFYHYPKNNFLLKRQHRKISPYGFYQNPTRTILRPKA